MRLNSIKAEEITFGSNVLDINVPDHLRTRVPTGTKYFDLACGGEGLTPSVVYMFTGTPGAGKSTMMQFVGDGLTGNNQEVIYVSGEESPYQIKLVSERLGLKHGFRIASETHLPTLFEKLDAFRARMGEGKNLVLIFDSLQAMDDGKYKDGHKNSQTPLRAVEAITDYCKEHGCIAIVIGQVTKGGDFAGSQKIIHCVDAHIHLSVEEKDEEMLGMRYLRTLKNRFGQAGTEVTLMLDSDGFDIFDVNMLV